MFEEKDIIYAYTWDDACDDGTFVNVSGTAKGAGFTMPVAITRTLFDKIMECSSMNLNEGMKDMRLNAFLMLLAIHIKELIKKGKADSNRIKYYATLDYHMFEDNEVTETWVNIEARSPQNPEPAMTIMLPSDY